jgi:hypothetical protein
MECYFQPLWVVLGCLFKWLIYLLAGGRSWSADVWKMVSSCLLLCLWREQNDRNFEDQERTIDELKAFFYSLFSWTAAFLALLVISFNDFLILFSSHS